MASHRFKDDVPHEVKLRRHEELTAAFRECSEQLNRSLIGKQQVVLIEGVSYVLFAIYDLLRWEFGPVLSNC